MGGYRFVEAGVETITAETVLNAVGSEDRPHLGVDSSEAQFDAVQVPSVTADNPTPDADVRYNLPL